MKTIRHCHDNEGCCFDKAAVCRGIGGCVWPESKESKLSIYKLKAMKID
ncbi:MAG: hypothetical protein ACRC13_13790 [Tannerellaceae bacterium]